jgi:hypothetical protein
MARHTLPPFTLEIRNAGSGVSLGSKTVHLAHSTAREYLLSVTSKIRVPFSDREFRNNYLAQLCLRYLQYNKTWEPSGQPEDDVYGRPFRAYADNLWHQYVNIEASNYQEVVRLVNNLLHRLLHLSSKGATRLWEGYFVPSHLLYIPYNLHYWGNVGRAKLFLACN